MLQSDPTDLRDVLRALGSTSFDTISAAIVNRAKLRRLPATKRVILRSEGSSSGTSGLGLDYVCMHVLAHSVEIVVLVVCLRPPRWPYIEPAIPSLQPHHDSQGLLLIKTAWLYLRTCLFHLIAADSHLQASPTPSSSPHRHLLLQATVIMALNARNGQVRDFPGPQTSHRPTPRGGFISRGVNAVTGLAAEAIASRKDNKADPTTYSNELAAPTSREQGKRPSSQDHLGGLLFTDTKKSNISDDASDLSDLDSDEEELDLDEAAQDIRTGNAEGLRKPPPTGNMLSPAAIKILANSFVELFPPPTAPVGTLQLPVILPQRRPGNKRRGFVQAYAPMLEQAGIGEAAFLSFCDYFEQAIKVVPREMHSLVSPF